MSNLVEEFNAYRSKMNKNLSMKIQKSLKEFST